MTERDDRRDSDLLAEKAAQRRTSFLADYWRFLREERKWWMLPVLVVLFLAGGIIVLAGTAGAPLLYALF
jgi:Family of unknown function (DUF5989)